MNRLLHDVLQLSKRSRNVRSFGVLSHVHGADNAQAVMVDVSNKPSTIRTAKARAIVCLPDNTMRAYVDEGADTINTTARIAGIGAAKQTAHLIPLCHSLLLTKIDIEIERCMPNHLHITSTVRCTGGTGVEMEALTAVSVSALTVYDMLKASSHDIEIKSIRLIEKAGGKSAYTFNQLPVTESMQ
jgi:cyclic pyranopterin phosphate synthase